eukprot:GFUD01121944.1.p1 GENE.GFUD01121944.1~~GFUD01121944.1.p1  ORF type:complete len:470 (-),score=130.59 GFUD01121944.1:207-1616(-)
MKEQKMDVKGNICPSPSSCVNVTRPPPSPSCPAVPSTQPPSSPSCQAAPTTMTQHKREAKLATADAVLQLVNQLQVTLTSQHDINLLAAALYERDLTISTLQMSKTRLEDEVTFLSRNGELQLEQSLWLHSMVQEREETILLQYRVISGLRDSLDTTEFHDRNLEISRDALEQNMALLHEDVAQQEATITVLEGKVAALTAKQQVSNKMQATSAQLLSQYKVATTSMQALLSKQHKTRLIMGTTSLRQTTCETKPVVRDEMAQAKARLRQKEESAYMAKLITIVDSLSGGPAVARYSPNYPPNNLPSQEKPLHPDHLPDASPREFFGLWTFLQEPTKEEMKIYKKFLLGPPPALIFVPDPRPKVNWSRLNKHQLRNLPDPQWFPILSAPADPDYYATTYLTRYGTRKVDGQDYQRTLPPAEIEQLCAGTPPFGTSQGLKTNLGIITMPQEPVHGYTWDDNEWVIAAVAY